MKHELVTEEPHGRTSFEHTTPVFPQGAAEIDLSPDENGVEC